MYGIGYEKSDVKTRRTGSGFKALTSDSHFPKLQENFEHNLGKYAYRNKNAIAAVDKGLAKMRKVLVTYYKDKYSHIKDQAEREAQICLDAFTNTDDPTSAGQVGNVKYEQLCEIIGSNIPEGDKEINSQIDKQTGMAGASNLREKMTAFYNAAYYKGYEDKNPEKNITNFKNIAQKIAVGGQSELVDELDLDSSILEEQKNTSTDPRKAGIIRALYNAGAGHKIMGFFGKIARVFNKDFNKDEQFYKRMHTQDVYDMALISLDQKNMGAMMDNIRSGSNLRYRDENEQKEVQRSLDYYDKMGLNLSEREKSFILESVSQQYLKSHRIPEQGEKEEIGTFKKGYAESTETFNKRMRDYAIRYAVYMDKIRKKIDPNYTPEESLEKEIYEEFANDSVLNEEVENTKSPIKEGIVYKDIPKKGGFLKDTMVDKHNVRIVNGISMTTARMLKTYKWLNLKSDLKNFRLALMGWMLPTDDHSLWEIIIGSHNVGVKGEEDLTDIVSLDQTVDPLKKYEIKKSVCEKVDGQSLFPHEIVYLKQRSALGEDTEGYRKTNTIGSQLIDSSGSYESSVTGKTGNLFMSKEEKDIELSLNDEKEKISNGFKEIIKLAYPYFKSVKYNEKVPEKTKKDKYEALMKKINEHKDIYIKIFDDVNNISKLESILLSYKSISGNNLNIAISEIMSIYEKTVFTSHEAEKLAVLNYTGDAYQPMNEAATSASGYFKKLYFKSSLKNHLLDSSYGVSKLEARKRTLNRKIKEDKKSAKVAKSDEEKGKFAENIENYEKELEEINKKLQERKSATVSDDAYQQYLEDLDTEINMTGDALNSVTDKSGVHVYSGTWMAKNKLFSSYKENKTITWNMFTSTSKNIEVAKGFIGGLSGLSGAKERFGKNALLDIKLNGKNAVDLADGEDDKKVMSIYDRKQAEVLCPPGTKIKVKEVIDDVDLRSYKGEKNEKPKVMSKEDYEEENKKYEELKSSVKMANKNRERITEKHALYKYNSYNKRFGTLIKCEEV